MGTPLQGFITPTGQRSALDTVAANLPTATAFVSPPMSHSKNKNHIQIKKKIADLHFVCQLESSRVTSKFKDTVNFESTFLPAGTAPCTNCSQWDGGPGFSLPSICLSGPSAGLSVQTIAGGCACK